jgi:hypothetical protein
MMAGRRSTSSCGVPAVLLRPPGLIVGLLFILHSRSEQRVLRQSERRFRALIQNSSQVILVAFSGRAITAPVPWTLTRLHRYSPTVRLAYM